MQISILTLFPDMFRGPFDFSIIRRAKEKNAVSISLVDIRTFATDAYQSVDDHPYGGGHGMILRVDVMDRALADTKARFPGKTTHTVLMDPQGTPYSQKSAKRLSGYDHLILIAGHYEGVDERIRQLVDEEISIGDYVLSCGELPAMVVVDSIVRLLPGVLKKEQATEDESFGRESILEYPQYTRPPEYNGMKVPEVLIGGDHKKIGEWRSEMAKRTTRTKRPDLL